MRGASRGCWGDVGTIEPMQTGSRLWNDLGVDGRVLRVDRSGPGMCGRDLRVVREGSRNQWERSRSALGVFYECTGGLFERTRVLCESGEWSGLSWV